MKTSVFKCLSAIIVIIFTLFSNNLHAQNENKESKATAPLLLKDNSETNLLLEKQIKEKKANEASKKQLKQATMLSPADRKKQFEQNSKLND